MKPSSPIGLPPAARRIYCNRTLNLRAIQAVGYDMDYTLVHYRVEPGSARAYEHVTASCSQAAGWPVADLRFDPDLVIRGPDHRHSSSATWSRPTASAT